MPYEAINVYVCDHEGHEETIATQAADSHLDAGPSHILGAGLEDFDAPAGDHLDELVVRGGPRFTGDCYCGPLQLRFEIFVVLEPPVRDVDALREPDGALGERIVEEVLQPGNACRLADQPRM